MAKLINQPDINTFTGLRHRTVMTLLYDSGCRVQELCDLMIRDAYTGSNPTVRLQGKGNKYRTVTISEKTAILISEYIRRQRHTALADEPLIINRTHEKISRDGVNHIINKYVTEIHFKAKMKLELSQEKTYVTDLRTEGIHFLGFVVKAERKRKTPDPKTWTENLVGKPLPDMERLKEKIRKIADEVRKIKKMTERSVQAAQIQRINSMIVGVAQYLQPSICSIAFHAI